MSKCICGHLTREESLELYRGVLEEDDKGAMRELCLHDLFFLLVVAFQRKDVNKEWLYARCREVEAEPDGMLDLWSREHYKSTIITYALTIKDILNDPEITVGIFSHTRPIAKAFLEQIQREFESNDFLRGLFPDILYENPKRESPVWSQERGIMVKRKSNDKEPTVQAHGLVDGQPTSKHFSHMIYDDVVTRESVTTTEQMNKTTEAWELSLNLSSAHKRAGGAVVRYIGTRYHFNDTWRVILERESAKPRIYAATDDGTVTGKPVFLPVAVWTDKLRDMSPYILSCQLLQNPVAAGSQGFREDWLRYYEDVNLRSMNVYITVDPSHGKKKENDYTVILVHALGPDGNYYLVDGVRDRLNLAERAQQVFRFVQQYRPIRVGYERYGLQADIEHIKYIMEQHNYRFDLAELGGSMNKTDRILQLVPLFKNGRYLLPHRLVKVNVEGKTYDLTGIFIASEYKAFPVATHDDMLDCMARIVDAKLDAAFPIQRNNGTLSLPTQCNNVNPNKRK